MTFFLSKTVAQSRAAGFAAFGGASVGIVIHSVLVAAGAFGTARRLGDRLHRPEDSPARPISPGSPIDAIRHGSSSVARQRAERRERASLDLLKGLLVNLLNPKVIIFFVTFLPQFVSADEPHAAGKLLFLGLVVHGSSTFRSAAHSSSLPSASRSPSQGFVARVTRFVDWLFAGVLGAFAVKLIFTHAR